MAVAFSSSTRRRVNPFMLHYFFHAHNPPRITLDPDLDFVLRVAFGANRGNSAHPASGSGAWRWAERLGLRERLVATLGVAQAGELLGSERLAQLMNSEVRLENNAAACEDVCARLARAAASSDIEIVLLRQAAIPADAGLFGSDPALELLVRDADYERLILALVSAGCATELRELPWSASRGGGLVLSGQGGAALGLHRQLRFLRMVPGGVFIDFDCLERCGQLLRDDVTPKNLWLPSKAVQAADVVAQLLVEQRFAPEFAAFQSLGLAQTLGLGHDDDLVFDAYLLLQTDVEHAEFEALRELLRGLEQGALHALSEHARTLLEHFVAAASVPSYRARLQLQRKAQVWQHEGHLERAAEGIGRALARITHPRTRA